MIFGPAGNRRVSGSGQPRQPKKPSKNMGGEAPHLLEWFCGPPGPPRPPKWPISDPEKLETYLPKCNHIDGPGRNLARSVGNNRSAESPWANAGWSPVERQLAIDWPFRWLWLAVLVADWLVVCNLAGRLVAGRLAGRRLAGCSQLCLAALSV